MNKKYLILDPLQHMPSLYCILGETETDYLAICSSILPGEPCYRNEQSFEFFYGFRPKTVLEELQDSYETVCIVLPMYAVVGIDRPWVFVKLLDELYKIIDKKQPKKAKQHNTTKQNTTEPNCNSGQSPVLRFFHQKFQHKVDRGYVYCDMEFLIFSLT